VAQLGAKTWAAIGLGAALVLGVGIAANAANSAASSTADRASGTSSPSPSPSVTPSPTPTPEVRTETAEEAVPFAAVTAEDAGHDVGWSAVTTAGQNGVKTKTYRVTYVAGAETARELVSEVVTTAPVDQVTSVGTRQPAPPPAAAPAPAPQTGGGCDPNYSGACVPIASDVDCAGGSGNGPAYVQGPVTVVGRDIYDLDRDGDGVGCDG